MARKKQIKSSTSKNKNETVKSLKDPKFQYKCFVRLESCDFSKLFNAFSRGRDMSKQPTNNKKTISKDKLNTLNDIIIHKKTMNNDICESMAQRKNCNDVLQPPKILINTNHSTMQRKHVIVKTTDMLEKINEEDLGLVGRKLLRARKTVNYKERQSIGTPDVSQNISLGGNKRIPIYRKVEITSPKCRKRKGDLYDFIPEPDEEKDSDESFKINSPIKKKKVKRIIHFQKQNIRQKVNHSKINGVGVKYKDKIDGIMDKFTEKLKNKSGTVKLLQTNIRKQIERDHMENSGGIFSNSVFNSTMLPKSKKITLLDDSIISKGFTDQLSEISIMGAKKTDNTTNVCIPPSENSNLHTGQDSSYASSSFKSTGNMSIRSFVDENLDNLFGFTDDMEENEGVNNQINVEINKTQVSKHYISTPKRFPEKKSWRFDNNIVNRNPHFLTVKKNSLPALNQDPVLDHTFDERIDVVNKTVLASSDKKSRRQQSIRNYLETAKEYSDNHHESQSLYDIDELSPLKDKNNGDKENSSEKKKLRNGNLGAKRNILGIINDDNIKNKISMKNNKEVVGQKADSFSSDNNMKDKTSNESISFGFDVTEDEQIDEQRPKPFRIEFTYKNNNKPKKLPDTLTKPVRDSEVRRLIEEDPGFEEVVDKDELDCGELRLFEDIEQSPKPSKVYKFPKKKITDQDMNKNKAPKDKLSKDAKKWIKQFNEMCDEVENEELDIE